MSIHLKFHRRALFGAPLLAASAPALAGDEFDFDTPYDRYGSDSTKWDAQARIYGKDAIDVPMGISDTDFRSSPVITKALTARVRHESFGYLAIPQSFNQAIIDWNQRRYGITINPANLLLSTGVTASLISGIRAFSPPGSKVLLLTPTYDGFLGPIRAAGCIAEESPLRFRDGRYQMDLEALDRHISRDTNTLILCNPNNPTGNVWTKEELLAVGELCTRRRVVILVDEVHCDFVTKGQKYTPFASLENRDVVMNSVTFKSASKSFNLSGLKSGWLFSDNPEYIRRIAATGHRVDMNTMGMVASHAALTGGEEWLNEVIAYLDANHDYLEKFISEKIPLMKYQKAQGTYLAWVDVTALIDKIGAQAQAVQAEKLRTGPGRPITAEAIIRDYLIREAKVQILPGTNYGHNGVGHMRMNLGTSRKTLTRALNNIASALARLA
ncbi:MAG: aminotransferase class I/II-fold pyridoxal phosphate-dependent enzyme [Acidobacteria bacterium]|nr:aminotransferase class I/II-fold pyridoxal phosphate-dependent enzyme [Acidobacteriota bacterium]